MRNSITLISMWTKTDLLYILCDNLLLALLVCTVGQVILGQNSIFRECNRDPKDTVVYHMWFRRTNLLTGNMSVSIYSVFVEHVHGYKNHSHFETNLYWFFSFFCVEPSVFNHLFLSNRDTSVLAKQLVVCLLLLDELSYSLLLVACLYPFCTLLVAGLSIAKVLGNQAVRPKFLSSPSRLVSDAEASLVYVVNFRTAGAT